MTIKELSERMDRGFYILFVTAMFIAWSFMVITIKESEGVHARIESTCKAP